MNTKNLFPELSKATEAQLNERPIKLNGQKVLFVEKVKLMPVELKKELKKLNGK